MKEKIISIIKSPLIYVLAIVVLVQTYIYKTAPAYSFTPDSPTYYEEYLGGSLLKGQFDELRTPVYPYFIKIIKLFSNDNNIYNKVVFVQKILFFLTLILVFCSMMKITKSKVISSAITLFVGILPNLVLFNTMILTEPLGIFKIVLLMYLVISYIYKPHKLKAISTSILVFFYDINKTRFYIFNTNICGILSF